MEDNPFGQNYSTGGGDGGGFFGGANGSQEGGKRVGTNSLRPVTIRQVLNASQPHSDAPFTFDNAELSQVTLVAWVQNISRNATNVSYTLDDGTGQLDVRQWIDNSADEGAAVDEFKTNEFVRILGEIKSFNNKRSVTAASISRLEDSNEYLFHQLDVIYTHLQLSKGATRRIYQAIAAEAPDWPDGVDVEQVVARCKNAEPTQIQYVCYAFAYTRDAIDELANDGYIYQASDETHYLTTAG